MSRVMRPVHTRCMYGYMYGDMRADRRDVSDPRGRGRDRSPGRGGGSLTSRLQYQPGFRAGRARRPAVTDAARAVAANMLLLWRLTSETVVADGRPDGVIQNLTAVDKRTNSPWAFVPLFVRG